MSYHRALLLYDRRRYDLAGAELRRGLTREPGHAPTHALMALCLNGGHRHSEALTWAREAVRIDPGLPFGHYARAVVLAHLRRFDAAREAAEEAIRLDPTRSTYFFLLAAIHCDRKRPREALRVAEHGLQLDPVHTGCASIRALALTRLGRRDEAEAAIADALARDPENDFTHAAKGWKLLHQRDRRRAVVHFREALRLNAENRWAKQGLTIATRPRAWRLLVPLALLLAVETATSFASGYFLMVAFGAGLIAIVLALRVGFDRLQRGLRARAQARSVVASNGFTR